MTNYKIWQLRERVDYYENLLLNESRWRDFIKRDLKEAIANLEEGLNRVYVGEDNKKAKAYVLDNVLWVEGKPSGWPVRKEEMVTGFQKHVCYDSGTNWIGVITFY